MTKMMQNLLIKLKITDFLLGFEFCTKRHFCRYWRVTCVYQFLYMYVKRSSRHTPLKVYRWRYRGILPHPMKYWPSDVFRPGHLSNMRSLGKIGHFMPELQQHLFPWRDIELCDGAMVTPFNENSRSSQFNIAQAFRIE